MNRKEIHDMIVKMLNNVPDKARSEAVEIHDAWMPYNPYAANVVVQYSGTLYRCLMAHTSEDTWTPPQAPSLWAKIMYRDGIRIIPDVMTAADAFARDEVGWWGDDLYKSRIDSNVWTPEAYPAGWEVVK